MQRLYTLGLLGEPASRQRAGNFSQRPYAVLRLTGGMKVTTNLTKLTEALKTHARSFDDNVYSIGVGDILEYIETDLRSAFPDLFNQVAALDPAILAIEIADAIGEIGILEMVEQSILETIRKQVEARRAALRDALSERDFIEEVRA